MTWEEKVKILQEYLLERDKLDFCVNMLDKGIKLPEKRAYYENYANIVNDKLAKMEDANSFIFDIIQILEKDTEDVL